MFSQNAASRCTGVGRFGWKAETPSLTQFATLSPVPGFRRWLEGKFDAGAKNLLTPDALERLDPRGVFCSDLGRRLGLC